MNFAYGISTTRITKSVIECTIPAIGVRPPFLILAAVRAIAPVAGIPPNNTEPILPIPCPISSWLLLCLLFTIPSATTAERRDSIAARIAIVNAFGISFLISVNEKCGTETDGRPAFKSG